MTTLEDKNHAKKAETSRELTRTDVRQGQRIKGMWIVLSVGVLMAILLMGIIALPIAG